MKKQLLILLLTAGCIPAIIEKETKQNDTDTKAQTALVCKNCRRK